MPGDLGLGSNCQLLLGQLAGESLQQLAGALATGGKANLEKPVGFKAVQKVCVFFFFGGGEGIFEDCLFWGLVSWCLELV